MHLGGASAREAAVDAGVAGMIVLLAVDVCLCLYDKYVSKENNFSTPL